jgi:O-antigen biosynthesis protein
MGELNRAEAYFQLAETARQQGKLDEAVVFYRKANLLRQSSISPQERSVLEQARKEQLVMPAANSLNQDIKVMAETYIQQAETYLKQGKPEPAIATCQQALQVMSNSALAYKLMGNAKQMQGGNQDAMRCYVKAIEIAPDFAEVYANLGSLYVNQQQWQQAIAAYQKAIEIKPDFAGAYRNLAKIWQAIGNTAQANICRERALTLEPKQISSPVTSQAIRNNGNGKGIINSIILNSGDTLESSVDRETVETYIVKAQSHVATKRWQEAINLCQQAIQIKPNNEDAYKILGNVMQSVGKTKEAVQFYQKALQLQPKFAEVHANLGSLCVQQQQWESALSHYQAAIMAKPDFVGAYRNLEKILTQLGRFGDAAECKHRRLELNLECSSVEDLTDIGNILFRHSKVDRAIAAYKQVIQKDPSFMGAYFNLATILSQQGKLAGANELYRKAIEINMLGSNSTNGHHSISTTPQFPTSNDLQSTISIPKPQITLNDCLQHAKSHLAKKQYKQAISLCKQIIVDPDNPLQAEAWQMMGKASHALGQLESAKQYYQIALQLDADLAETHDCLGTIYAEQNQWQEAISAYQKAIAIDSNFASAYRHLAGAFMQIEQPINGAESWFKAFQLEPAWATAEEQLNLGNMLLKQGKLEKAISCYQQAIQINPQLSQAHHNLGEVLSSQKNWEAAIASYRKAILADPNNAGSANSMGRVLVEQNKYEEALAAYHTAIRINPKYELAHYNLGQVLSHLGKWDEAIAAYRQAIVLQPDLSHVQDKLANALRQRANRDLQDALGCYRKAIKENPNDLQNYHKALDIKPNDAELYVKLANALARQGNNDGAIVFYQMALQMQPDNGEVALQLSEIVEFKKKIGNCRINLVADNATNLYDLWLKENTPTPDELKRMAERVPSLSYKPLISIVMPTYNTSEAFLREAIQSVINQVYPYWELCIADDASSLHHVRNILEEYAAKDSRIKIVFRTQNGHISAASNSALKLATGEFVALLDHDDELAPHALYENALLLNQHPDADMIYSDEDKLNEEGKRVTPFFKPDWSPDYFLSLMYTCHLGIYRRNIVDKIGGFRIGYEGSQDYDLVLRVAEETDKIFHISKILYHWRIHAASTSSNFSIKHYAHKNGEEALKDALTRRGLSGQILSNSEIPGGTYTVRYEISDFKLVSIIIPTRNLGNVLDCCLTSIFKKSTYPNYEVVVIDNGSDELETKKIIAKWHLREPQRFKCYSLDVPFNFSHINNYAAEVTNGDYLLFLNNDTEVITTDWIEAMVEQAQRSIIGAVGALLLYPDGTIQHAGVILGIGDIAGHSHRGFPLTNSGYYNRITAVNNFSAVTGACLMCRREVFEEIGGFDETLAVAFNDVDLCLRMLQRNYNNIYLPHVVLYHHESKSRGYEDTPEKNIRFEREVEIMRKRWGEILNRDPYYSPHLTKDREDYSLSIPCNSPVNTEVKAVTTYQVNSDKLYSFCLDSPCVGTHIRSAFIQIAGWILGKTSPARKVELICKGYKLLSISVNHCRPDVALHQPTGHVQPLNGNGFLGFIQIADMPLSGLELMLRTVLEDGSSVMLGAIRFQPIENQTAINS